MFAGGRVPARCPRPPFAAPHLCWGKRPGTWSRAPSDQSPQPERGRVVIGPPGAGAEPGSEGRKRVLPSFDSAVLVILVLSRDSAPGGASKLHNAPGGAGQSRIGAARSAARVIFPSPVWEPRSSPAVQRSPPEPCSVASPSTAWEACGSLLSVTAWFSLLPGGGCKPRPAVGFWGLRPPSVTCNVWAA